MDTVSYDFFTPYNSMTVPLLLDFQAPLNIQGYENHQRIHLVVNRESPIGTLAWSPTVQESGSIEAVDASVQPYGAPLPIEQHPVNAPVNPEPSMADLDHFRSVNNLWRWASNMESDLQTRPYLLIFVAHPSVKGRHFELQLSYAISPLLRGAFHQEFSDAEHFVGKLSYVVQNYVHSWGIPTMPVVNQYNLAGALPPNRASSREPRKLFSEKSTKIVTAAKAMNDEFVLLFIMRPESKHRHNIAPKVEVSPLLRTAFAARGESVEERLELLSKICRTHEISH